MKKYIITESQLKAIIEKADPIPKDIIKAPPMSFQNYANAIKMEKPDGETDKGDLKSFVAAKMAGSRAQNFLDKTDDALNRLTGDFGSISGYSLASDDPIISDSDRLSVIILSLVYYFHKEGQLPSFKVNDVNMDFNKAYKIIKERGLGDFKVLSGIRLGAKWITSPTSDSESTITSPNGSIQVVANHLGGIAVLVRYTFMDSATLNKFYKDVISDKKILTSIKKFVGKNIIPSVKDGSLEFSF